MTARRFAGVSLDAPAIMGIINVTPDSFSDGGEAFGLAAALSRAESLAAAGAAILDVGGESTRPGADPVPVEEELHRVVPVVSALARAGHVVSVDTRRAAVMDAALDAGAAIVNDVTALTGDAESLPLVAARGAAVVLMHMAGNPRTMQIDPRYDDAPQAVCGYLAERVAACVAAGIPRERIAVDPGIGFGKTVEHNLDILADLGRLRDLGCAVLLGVSRKSFIGAVDGETEPRRRVAGSLAAALAGVARGVDILRVHDVAETRQALAVWRAIEQRNH